MESLEKILRAIFKQTIQSITLFFGVIIGAFVLFNIAPGDTARIILGPNASEESVLRLRHELGTDRPLFEQGVIYVRRVLQFDLGHSVVNGRSVSKEVLDKFFVSAKVGTIGVSISLLFSYTVNIIVYFYPSANFLIRFVRIGVITPTFFTGVMSALFLGVWFPIVPLTGTTDSSLNLFLPGIIVSLYPAALMTQLLHEKITNSSASDYVRAARAFGFPEWQIFHKFIIRNVVISWLATLVNQLSILFISSFILEVIFTVPGVGPLLINAIQQKDYPMLQGILIINAIFFIVLSWLNETFINWLDPRVMQYVET